MKHGMLAIKPCMTCYDTSGQPERPAKNAPPLTVPPSHRHIAEVNAHFVVEFIERETGTLPYAVLPKRQPLPNEEHHDQGTDYRRSYPFAAV